MLPPWAVACYSLPVRHPRPRSKPDGSYLWEDGKDRVLEVRRRAAGSCVARRSRGWGRGMDCGHAVPLLAGWRKCGSTGSRLTRMCPCNGPCAVQVPFGSSGKTVELTNIKFPGA